MQTYLDFNFFSEFIFLTRCTFFDRSTRIMRSSLIAGVVVVTIGWLSLLASSQSSYITQKAAGVWNNPSGPELTFSAHVKIFNHRKVTAFLAVVAQPMGYFHVLFPQLPNGTCGGYLNTTERASQEGCLFATNGGPFVMHQPLGRPTCLGYVVSNGTVVEVDSTPNVNFGLTSTGEFLLGVLTPDQVQTLGFEELVSGFGWLAQAGGNAVSQAGGEIAPRTAICTDAVRGAI